MNLADLLTKITGEGLSEYYAVWCFPGKNPDLILWVKGRVVRVGDLDTGFFRSEIKVSSLSNYRLYRVSGSLVGNHRLKIHTS